jgi:two-component system response regulator HupR/HoxA
VLKTRVEALEREMIEEALRRFDGNISRASEELGLSRVGLRNKIERYGVERDLRDDDE